MRTRKSLAGISFICVISAGCASLDNTPVDRAFSAPKWFEKIKQDAACSGYPDISAIPSIDDQNAPGKLLSSGLPLTDDAEIIFQTDPRAQPISGGREEIVRTKNAILALGLNNIPAPARHLSDAEIEEVNSAFQSK